MQPDSWTNAWEAYGNRRLKIQEMGSIGGIYSSPRRQRVVYYVKRAAGRQYRGRAIRSKPLFDQIASGFTKGVKWNLLNDDIKHIWEKNHYKSSKFLTQAFDILKLWSRNHPSLFKLGIGAGVALLSYGITTRITGGATLPRMREGYNEMQPGYRTSGDRKQLRHDLTDFGSKADLSLENTSNFINKTMMDGQYPNAEPARIAIDTLARIKGATRQRDPISVRATTTIRNRSLPHHPQNNGNSEIAIKRNIRATSLALDSKPYLNSMFRTHAVAGKGHRIRNTDHAKAMNITLNRI